MTGMGWPRAMVMAVVVAASVSVPHAEVVSKAPSGFVVKHVLKINATPAKVYEAALAVGKWWSSAHTYSGSASNITVDARPGGCWCEATPGGGVKHMEVVYLSAGKEARFIGGLGPLQAMAAAGAMTWTFAAAEGGTTFTLTYSVGGYSPAGFEALAPVVDDVIGQQMARLKQFAETGKVD